MGWLDPHSALGKAAANLRFCAGLSRFARERMSFEQACAIVRERLARRDERFLEKVRRAIFENPRSAYLRMLARAHIDYPRLEALVGKLGVEGTLEELRRRDVYVTYEEFKAINAEGRTPSERFNPGCDFDNPASGAAFGARSGGSRSAGSRLLVDFDSLHELSVHRLLRAAAYGGEDALQVRYLPPLPGFAGISLILTGNIIGERQARWFTPIDPRRTGLVHQAQNALIVGALRLAGGEAPWPRYVPLADVEPIARWVAERKREGRRCAIQGYAGSIVRVCAAAERAGLDIAGTHCYLVGEPVTTAKFEAVRRAGCMPIVSYSIAEAGHLANSCPHSQSADDLHFFSDSFGLIRHTRRIERFGREVEPFLLTTLQPGASKVMLNVEIDDYGTISHRPCDCVWGRLGLTMRVSGVRSFVKLTAEGMTLLGTNLVRVIEEELPARFGGQATEYQLLEEEGADGCTRLSLRVAPAVGALDEAAVREYLYGRLREEGAATRFFGEVWREADALRVVRDHPVQTCSGKIFPFHTLR